MSTMSARTLTDLAFEQGGGVVRLAPTWVPRSFCVPGRRLRLHPDDYYALGGERGGIDERWFSSTIRADNGPDTGEFEGLSRIIFEDGSSSREVLLRDAVDEGRGRVIGHRLWEEFGSWPIYSKFFDNQGPLPFHIHQRDEHVAFKDARGKPEAYYFPPQLNNHAGDFPHTFFGLQPGVTRDQIRAALQAFTKGDNEITRLSAAYRLKAGTGWDVPAGVLHAPGSFLTYEPQSSSDVFAMFESRTGGRALPEDLLWKDTPPEHRGDFDYLLDIIDWDANQDPDLVAKHYMAPREMERSRHSGSHTEKWICYLSPDYSASELTVYPGESATIADAAAYGVIVVQGHGEFGGWSSEAPALIRFGQMTQDEFFVTEEAARSGVTVTNNSKTEPLVLLKHFGPGNPDLDL